MNNRELIREFYKNNLIKKGEFQLKNGELSNYYCDMKSLISYPILLKNTCIQLFDLINIYKNKNINLICGVPLGGIPLSCFISTKYNIPSVLIRKEKKKYGMKKQIEGNYKKNQECILIEDVITTGSSVKEIIDIIKSELNIVCILSIINRNNLKNIDGIEIKSLFTEKDLN